MEPNKPCWCGSGKKYKKCHKSFDEKLHLLKMQGKIVPDRSLIKTPAQIEKIRLSADLNTAVLDAVAAQIHAGSTISSTPTRQNTAASRLRSTTRDSLRACVPRSTTRSATASLRRMTS